MKKENKTVSFKTENIEMQNFYVEKKLVHAGLKYFQVIL